MTSTTTKPTTHERMLGNNKRKICPGPETSTVAPCQPVTNPSFVHNEVVQPTTRADSHGGKFGDRPVATTVPALTECIRALLQTHQLGTHAVETYNLNPSTPQMKRTALRTDHVNVCTEPIAVGAAMDIDTDTDTGIGCVSISFLARGLDSNMQSTNVFRTTLCNMIYTEALKSNSDLLNQITTGVASVLQQGGVNWHGQYKRSNAIQQRDMILDLVETTIRSTMYVVPNVNTLVAKPNPGSAFDPNSSGPVQGFLRDVIVQRMKVELYSFVQDQLHDNPTYIHASAITKIDAISFVANAFANRMLLKDALKVMDY